MKLFIPILCLFLCGNALAQPRNQSTETETTAPALPTEELAKYILYLQETGQLPKPPIATPQQQNQGKNSNEVEAAKFMEATTGIFTGVINVFAGATLGNPIQIVSGILSALSAAINVAVYKAQPFDEQDREIKTKAMAQKIYRIINDRPLKRRI